MSRPLFIVSIPVPSIAESGHLFLSVFRRGYAAAQKGAMSGGLGTGGPRGAMVGKVEERPMIKEALETSNAWSPDPITGYYRPAKCTAEIDPVELREMLLNQRIKPQ